MSGSMMHRDNSAHGGTKPRKLCARRRRNHLSSTNKADLGDSEETGQPLASAEAQFIVPRVLAADSQEGKLR